MKSWKTTLGGSLDALGKTLMGVGVVPQLSGVHSSTLSVIASIGFGLTAIGGFFAHLFAADATAVDNKIQSNNIAMSGATNPAIPVTAAQTETLSKPKTP